MKNFLILCAVVLVSSPATFAQGTVENGIYRPTEDQIARNKQNAERLRQPSFIALRLLSNPRDIPHEASTDTPAPYVFKERISFRVLAIQSLFDEITVPTFRHPYAEVRPVLERDGEVVSYASPAKAVIADEIELLTRAHVNAHVMKMKAGVEYQLQEVRLDDWCEPLSPGRYELTVRRRFNWQGDWLSSTPIYFEVLPKPIPAPIPAGVSVEIVPEGLTPTQKTYNVTTETVLQVFTRNNSDQTVKVNTVGFFYSVRPQLFKDNVLISYRTDTANLMKSRDEDPRLSQLRDEILLEPGSRTGLTYIRLADWYDNLSAGSYRLTVRQRFEIDGRWTNESAPLLFEVVPSKKN